MLLTCLKVTRACSYGNKQLFALEWWPVFSKKQIQDPNDHLQCYIFQFHVN